MDLARDLSGSAVWVTGSSRGIGRAIATRLASRGAKVAVHGSSATSVRAFGEGDTLDGVCAEMADKTGSEIIPVHGDLTDELVVRELAETIRRAFGRIDILVNSAGGNIGAEGTSGARGGRPKNNDAIGISTADIRSVLERNFLTCVLACREVVPEMMERRAGAIVNLGSIAGLEGRSESAIYGAAKAAVHQYSRSLAQQLRSYNVRVNVVAPGQILSPRFKATQSLDKERLLSEGSLDRYGSMEEVARLVEYLVSDTNSYISGQIIRIDGGLQIFPA